jgi:hypothetical protein
LAPVAEAGVILLGVAGPGSFFVAFILNGGVSGPRRLETISAMVEA